MRVRWLRLAAIICAVVAAICCFVLPAAALDATYTFSDFGMSVKFPKEFNVITRDTNRTDPVFEAIGLDYDQTMTAFHAAGIYLRAYEPENTYQISLTVTKNESSEAVNNYGDLNEAQRKSISDALVADESVSSAVEVKHNNIIFFDSERELKSGDDSVYLNQSNTIVNGLQIDLVLQKEKEPITTDEAKVLTAAANSLSFDNIKRAESGPKFDWWRLLLWAGILVVIAVAVSILYKRRNDAQKRKMEERRRRHAASSGMTFGKVDADESAEPEEAWQMTFEESLGYRDDEEFTSRAAADEMAGYDIKVRDRDPNKGVAYFEDGGDGIDDGSDYFDTYFKEPTEERTTMQRMASTVNAYSQIAVNHTGDFFKNLFKKLKKWFKKLFGKVKKLFGGGKKK